ncbi:MAG: alpha/beta fold hydrolase [Chloroflexota bacterium]
MDKVEKGRGWWLAGLFVAVMLNIAMALPLNAASLQQASTASVTCAQNVFVQPGDTLSIIAGRTLGSATAYQQIVDATNAIAETDASYTIIRNVNVINVGWKLCIPDAERTPRATSTATSTRVLATTPTTTPATTPTARPTTRPTIDPDAPDVTGMRDLHIRTMQAQTYPGSEITIERTLTPGVNYNQYVVSYRSDGLKIYALMTIPFGETPITGWPVVIFNHGYIPPEIYRTTERYVAYVDAFARNGYIVFKSDYRGHGISEGSSEGGSYRSPGYTVDVLNALASMKNYPAADPNRIGMWGHSMGGYITLRSMVISEDIKAGVIWAGVVASYTDLMDRWATRPGPWLRRAIRWRDASFAEFGTPQENPAFWDGISANSYLSELSGPIELHHGTNDYSVPVEFSQDLEAQIQAVNGDVSAYIYAGDNHNISISFNTAMARSVAFFDKHVKNIQ